MSAHHILGLKSVPRLGCSPIKVVRELGSERRETVRPLSIAGVRDLKGAALYERTGVTDSLVYQLSCQGYSWVAMSGTDKR